VSQGAGGEFRASYTRFPSLSPHTPLSHLSYMVSIECRRRGYDENDEEDVEKTRKT
jgi:hypothetical protein